ncbi:MAG: CAP domain-containing protein [Bacilli bacterium]
MRKFILTTLCILLLFPLHTKSANTTQKEQFLSQHTSSIPFIPERGTEGFYYVAKDRYIEAHFVNNTIAKLIILSKNEQPLPSYFNNRPFKSSEIKDAYHTKLGMIYTFPNIKAYLHPLRNTQQANRDFATRTFHISNYLRTTNNIRPLKLDPLLNKVAAYHSNDMANRGYFSHQSPSGTTFVDRYNQFSISYRSAGENIAKNYTTPLATMLGLYNSTDHRNNILNRSFQRFGSAYKNGYYTQNFRD